MTRTITIPAPIIRTGPSGMTPEAAAVMYLETVIDRVEATNELNGHGSGVRALVVGVLRSVAEASKAGEPTDEVAASPTDEVAEVLATEGWALPTLTARKFHYFRGGRSLCGKYGCFGVDLQPDRPGANLGVVAGMYDCRACSTKLRS